MKIIALAFVLLLLVSTLSIIIPLKVEAKEITWNTNPTPLPSPTRFHVSVMHNDSVYVIGGAVAEQSVIPEVYFANVSLDGAVGSWGTTTPLPEGRGAASAVVWNDFVYLIGGCGPIGGERNTVFYAQIGSDGTIGNWTTTTPLPLGLQSVAGFVWKEVIYVAGGWTGSEHRSTVYYAETNPDGSLASWHTTTSLPSPRAGMCALVYDDVVYMIGGLNSGGSLNSVIYASINLDGTLGPWIDTTSLPESRSYVRAVLIGDSIYVVGGETWDTVVETPKKTVFETAVKPDRTVGDWTQLQDLPEARLGHTVIAFQNRIYAIGGEDKVGEEWITKDTIYRSSRAGTPAVSLLSPRNETYYSNSIPLIFNVDEPTNWTGYSFDGNLNETIDGNTTLRAEEGSHEIVVYANDTAGNMGASEIIYFSVEIHDIAVLSVNTSKTGCVPFPVACQNYTVSICVVVENQGDYSENFNLSICANEDFVETQSITLAVKDILTKRFIWNTTSFSKGNYTISAYAEPVFGEMNTSNNILAGDWIIVSWIGDINYDGKVDVKDVYKVALAYGTSLESPNPPGRTYNPNCDINDDGKVDVKDYYIVCKHYGEVDP